MLVRFLFRMPVKDASGAFRCYRVSKLAEVRLDRMIVAGLLVPAGSAVPLPQGRVPARASTPILFENRRAGKSKVNPKEAVRSIATILYLGVRALLGFERQASRRPAVQT